MALIQARIDELQKQLIDHQIAEAKQKIKKTIPIDSIEQLEEFCNISDKILDRPLDNDCCSLTRFGLRGRARADALAGEEHWCCCIGTTLKEVFKSKLNPKHPFYTKQKVKLGDGRTFVPRHGDFQDLEQYFQKSERAAGIRRRRGGHGSLVGKGFSEVDKEIITREWERGLEERIYSTTSANDVYINETFKCILGILKKQQQEINWLKSKLSESAPPV